MALGSDLQLLLKIKGDSSDAVSALNRTQKETKELDTATKGLGGTFSSLVNPAALVSAGIIAISTAAIAGAKAVFDLTIASAEFGSEIFDATQKTGLGAEAISAMKLAADQSGTSLDQVTTSLSRFAKVVGDAGNGSDEAQAKLNRLGVTSRDLDTALGQALTTIAKLPPGIQQMTAAQDAFGRSGADLLPFIKSFDGDLTKLVATAKKLGVTITDEAAKAADEFGDTLDTLKAQAAATGRAFVGPLMNDITRAMKDISGSLAKNQVAVREWGEEVRQTLSGLKNAAVEVYNFSQTRAGRALSLLLFGGIQVINEGVQQLASPVSAAPNTVAPAIDYSRPQDRNKAQEEANKELDEKEKKAADDRAKAREAAAKRELAALSTQNRLRIDAERNALQEVQGILEKAFIARSITEKEYAEKTNANLRAYLTNIKALLDQGFKIDSVGATPSEIGNLDLERINAINAVVKEINREASDAIKNIAGQKKEAAVEQKKADEEEQRRQKEINEERLKALDDQAEAYRGLIELRKESLDVERTITDVLADRTRKILSDNVASTPRGPERNAALLALRNFEIAEATRKQQQAQADLEREKNESIARLTIAELEIGKREELEELYRQKALLSEEEFQSRLAQIRDAFAADFDVDGGIIGQIDAAISSLGENITLIDLAAQAFQNLANGIASAIQQYVLYGKSAPAALRQVLAATLAQIAAEAAVQAIRAAAYGFLFLAMHDYSAAANAFISAAIWGSIAVGAALIGRAIAPKQANAASQQFKGAASGSGGSGQSDRESNSGRGAAYSDRKEITIEANRNTPFTQRESRVHVTVGLDSNGVLALLKSNASSNGEMRNLVLNIVGEN